ncbi:hypothetical protein CDIK_3529, partial [Cucumispora dikerogammari]
ENIVMGIYNKNFKLNFVRERLFMCAETSYKKSGNCLSVTYELKHEGRSEDRAGSEKVIKKSRISKEKTAEFFKTTKMNNFRKALGISGKEIETSQFKLRFDLFFLGEYYGPCKRITFETEKFGFRLNKDGILVLNNPIKSKSCVKCMGLNQ